MRNIKTSKVTETRDVIFLDKMYGEVYDTKEYTDFLAKMPSDEEKDDNGDLEDNFEEIEAKCETNDLKNEIKDDVMKLSHLKKELKT